MNVWLGFGLTSHKCQWASKTVDPKKGRATPAPKRGTRLCAPEKDWREGSQGGREGAGWAGRGGGNKLAPAEPVKRRPSPAPAKVTQHLLPTFCLQKLFLVSKCLSSQLVYSVEVSVVDLDWLHQIVSWERQAGICTRKLRSSRTSSDSLTHPKICAVWQLRFLNHQSWFTRGCAGASKS